MANKSLSFPQVYRKFIWTGLALMAVLLTGTVGYRIISAGNSSLIDCLYMTFTNLLVLSGSVIFPGIFPHLVALTAEGYLKHKEGNFYYA